LLRRRSPLARGWDGAKSACDASGNLAPVPTYFPLGMKDPADYVHAKGLKLGMYACPTTASKGIESGAYSLASPAGVVARALHAEAGALAVAGA
jgi:hypothetical protein